MAYETFTPPGVVNASPGSSVAFKPRVREAPFGDGYVQRSGDGLNANKAMFDVAFSVLTDAEAQTVLDFFASKKGYVPFMFTLPGELAPRQWIATEWQKSFTGKRISDVAAKFEEDFTP